MRPDRQLLFENGAQFLGNAFGAVVDSIDDVIFHTAMVGYQEILSNPVGYGQLVVMTYPLIGNYGMTDDDYESKIPKISGLVVREYNDIPSNYCFTRTLSDVMQEHGIPGISGVDTRQITHMLREKGTMRAIITDAATSIETALCVLREAPIKRDHVTAVSCKKLWYARTANYRYRVVAIDCGIKQSIIRQLNQRGCDIAIVPYNTSPEQIVNLCPDGLFLSDGPGNPMDAYATMDVPALCRMGLPILGTGLGCQLIALCHGATLQKMTSGHFGGNYPVKSISSARVDITPQEHLYTIARQGVNEKTLTITHTNLLDDTVEGIRSVPYPAIGVQFTPESASGANNGDDVIDAFIQMMETFRMNGGDIHA